MAILINKAIRRMAQILNGGGQGGQPSFMWMPVGSKDIVCGRDFR